MHNTLTRVLEKLNGKLELDSWRLVKYLLHAIWGPLAMVGIIIVVSFLGWLAFVHLVDHFYISLSALLSLCGIVFCGAIAALMAYVLFDDRRVFLDGISQSFHWARFYYERAREKSSVA